VSEIIIPLSSSRRLIQNLDEELSHWKQSQAYLMFCEPLTENIQKPCRDHPNALFLLRRMYFHYDLLGTIGKVTRGRYIFQITIVLEYVFYLAETCYYLDVDHQMHTHK